MHLRRNCLRYAPTLATLLILLGGCAVVPATNATSASNEDAPPPASSASAPAEEPAPRESPTAQTQYHVLAGEMAAGRQQPRIAAEEFLQALDTAPDKGLAERATTLALQAGDADLALTAARRWLTLDATSLEAREVIVSLSLRAGLDEEAYEQCDRIVRDHPGGQDDGFHHVAILLQQEPDKSAAALALMQRLVAAYPKLAGAYRAQSLLALRFDQVELAEQAARASLTLQPHSKESSLLLIGALIKKGDIAESDRLMDEVTHNSPNATDLRLNYAQLLIESNQSAPGREQLEKVLHGEPGNVDAHYLLGLLSLNERQLDEAQQHFEIAAKKPERQPEAQYFLGRVAESRHDAAGALGHYEKVVSGPRAIDAAVRRAAMLGKLGRLDEAQSLLDQLREQLPQMSERFVLAEGEILLDAGAADHALTLYNEALAKNADDPDLLYARSLVYDHGGQTELAEADLRHILNKTPDDARALNALGYMLTIHSDHFDEAQQLIEKALKLTPDDPAVMDSQGWLSYRRGRAQDALPLLQKAYAAFPDAEIAAHLGEVLWSLGNKDQARALLSTAAQNDPDNTALRDAVKRIEQ